MSLSIADLEGLWTELAGALSELDADGQRLFLAKLVLLMANAAADADRTSALIGTALADLPRSRQVEAGSVSAPVGTIA